jgi:hypothetical protein
MFERPRWKRYAIVTLGVAALLSLSAAFFLRFLGRVPLFYQAVDALSAEERTNESRQFVRQSTAIFNQIENEPAWSGVFRERQVNAWLAWDFARKHAEILPRGVSEPRVSFDDGRITLGFHMQNGPVAVIVSARGRLWLPEPNFVAVELEAVRAGALPIPASVVVETVSTAAKSAGLEIEWRQHAGRPVALIRLGRPENQTAIRVDRVELREGLLYLEGRSAGRAAGRIGATTPDGSPDVSLNHHSPEPSSLHR